MSVLDDIEAIVRRVTSDFRYERLYPAEVVRVAGDLVDVLPDDPAVRGRGLQGVPMPTMDPTTELLPEPGCRCLLGFMEGNPQRPYIAAWEFAQNSATVRLNGGSAGLARKGDIVDVLITPGVVTVTGTAYLPAPVPFTGTATLAEAPQGVIIGGVAAVRA